MKTVIVGIVLFISLILFAGIKLAIELNVL